MEDNVHSKGVGDLDFKKIFCNGVVGVSRKKDQYLKCGSIPK